MGNGPTKSETDADIRDFFNGRIDPEPISLRQRHPAEVTTFLTGLAVIAVALGVDLSEDVLLAGLGVLASLPAVVTWLVNIYRAAIRDLGE